jgi:serine/threonine-protein kinase
MSPEQFTGKPIDARSDIYSISIIAYEMLTGTLPFTANTPWEWATQHMTVAPQPLAATALPHAMTQAVMRALAKDPEQRFPSTKAFFDAFSSGTPDLSPGFTTVPAGSSAATGPVEPQGRTQIGTPVGIPAGAFAPYLPTPGVAPVAMQGVATGALGGPARFGTAAAGDAPFQGAAIPPAPALSQETGRRGRGALVALLGLLGLVCAAAVVFAVTRHPTAVSVAGGALPRVAPVTTHADLSATAAPVDPNPLDTSVPPLMSATNTVPFSSGKKVDAGTVTAPTASTPSAAPSLTSPSPTPTLTPSTPSFDPRPCQRARTLRAKNLGDFKHRVELEKLEELCARAGGQL